MEITSAGMLKQLPDMVDIMELVEAVANAVVVKLTIDKEIKSAEAEIIKEAMANPVYHIGGKPPSMAFIQDTYAYTGFNKELLPLRADLIKATAEVEKLRSRLDLFKEFLSMWRSLNAAERSINA